MNTPSPEAVFTALDATWPALSCARSGPFRLRKGDGGGKRVSAATAQDVVNDADIDCASDAMRALGQTPLFMIRDGEQALDTLLESRGFFAVDPTAIYIAPAQNLARSYPITTIIPSWPPLAVQHEIWQAGGVDAARLRVMNRASDPKTSILGRADDTPGATIFVAASGDMAMFHALEVAPGIRRHGLGETLVRAAAHWAVDQGATWLALAVTRANKAANALYSKLGMVPVASYHYRRATEVTS